MVAGMIEKTSFACRLLLFFDDSQSNKRHCRRGDLRINKDQEHRLLRKRRFVGRGDVEEKGLLLAC